MKKRFSLKVVAAIITVTACSVWGIKNNSLSVYANETGDVYACHPAHLSDCLSPNTGNIYWPYILKVKVEPKQD